MIKKFFVWLKGIFKSKTVSEQFEVKVQKVPADQISVDDSSFVFLSGTDAQSAFESIDNEFLTLSSGVESLSSVYVQKAGDVMSGDLQVQGAVSARDIYGNTFWIDAVSGIYTSETVVTGIGTTMTLYFSGGILIGRT